MAKFRSWAASSSNFLDFSCSCCSSDNFVSTSTISCISSLSSAAAAAPNCYNWTCIHRWLSHVHGVSGLQWRHLASHTETCDFFAVGRLLTFWPCDGVTSTFDIFDPLSIASIAFNFNCIKFICMTNSPTMVSIIYELYCILKNYRSQR